ncbi:phosphotransferase [Parahaliea maris]|uniref:Phosphotransferase n=1 Tax=Parahaliea maris TaxID=2716870 RepID=A0A5C8ZWC3_9GAMM|nr:phosphotransferase [Parahaliea maris]TXS91860.1 phosphotransferase [Parahaliea maris]
MSGDNSGTEHTIFSEISNVRRDWSPEKVRDYIADLPIWPENTEVRQKFGGLTNRTYFAYVDGAPKYAIRVGFDQYRTRQTAVIESTLAAQRLGIGPRLIYAEPNVSVTEFVEGEGLSLEDMKDPDVMRSVIDMMKVIHNGGSAVKETISYWWPFDTIRRWMDAMEVGKAATDWQPSPWADQLPRLRGIVDRLERGIGPFIPTFTHNDMTFVNLFKSPSGEIRIIDWDGGAYGHPMFDLGEMLMWAEADEQTCIKAIKYYFGDISDEDLEQRLTEVHAFQTIAALRLVTECLYTDLDPYYHVTPEEFAEGMKEILPGQKAALIGLAEMLMPRFEELWSDYQHLFPEA